MLHTHTIENNEKIRDICKVHTHAIEKLHSSTKKNEKFKIRMRYKMSFSSYHYMLKHTKN